MTTNGTINGINGTTLTRRQREVTQLVCEGLSNKEIARRLECSDGTIKVHMHNIFERLNVPNRTALVTWWTLANQP